MMILQDKTQLEVRENRNLESSLTMAKQYNSAIETQLHHEQGNCNRERRYGNWMKNSSSYWSQKEEVATNNQKP